MRGGAQPRFLILVGDPTSGITPQRRRGREEPPGDLHRLCRAEPEGQQRPESTRSRACQSGYRAVTFEVRDRQRARSPSIHLARTIDERCE